MKHLKLIAVFLGVLFAMNTAYAKIVTRNGYILEVTENGCSMEVFKQNGVEYVRVENWDKVDSWGIFGKYVTTAWRYFNLLEAVELTDGSRAGHLFGKNVNGACYARDGLYYANNDCIFRENSGSFNSSHALIQYNYYYSYGSKGGPRNCAMSILSKPR